MLRATLLPLALLLALAAAPARAQEDDGVPLPPWATGQSRPEDLTISLVTFGPGDDIPSWFGHGSLVVTDRRLNQERLYNYGMFTFDGRMLARFLMGRLEFWVGEASALGTYRLYRMLDRDVRIQELNLPPEKRLVLARALAQNVLPQNREYLYHHYNDNCSTRLRDGIDLATGGLFHQAQSAPARLTLRGHTRRYTAVFAPMSLLLDFWMNDEIDQPITRWEEAFLPDELEKQVEAFRYPDGSPLVARDVRFHTSKHHGPTPEEPPAYGPWVLALGVALGLVALGLAQRARAGARWARVSLGLQQALLGFVLGLPGLLLMLMWLFTEHTVTHRNENLLLANPLTLLALPLGISLARGKNPRTWARLRAVWAALAVTGVLGLVLKVLPRFDQDNWRLIALILPISLGCAAGFLLFAPARRSAAEAEPLAPSAPRAS
ncbi:DUF4105 domain-containing protein [Aggregicoccus sp. 17bor-14]|uniref:Lnb N-terminal periplasmic domain-containing protein n=1 Tax=Myxococcaceae TaxID=31 RepID=UPI00129CAE88|nr:MULTISPECIES: DUF4105 domain-containing protein [Myxococcaceae]MBF5046337.1 DUF4105 domain-containing protein [Simulacricoccus sp. 17bor-14]MRI92057.1 DUF4105 domain-containing protein [Aggregicoccus sp. 17bor-14]